LGISSQTKKHIRKSLGTTKDCAMDAMVMVMENIYHQQYVEIVDPLSMAQVLFLVWSHGTSQNKNGLRRYNPGLVTKDVAKCWGSRTIRQP
jgi:hypothetical protein